MNFISIDASRALALRPIGCPVGVEPHVWRQAVRARVESHLAIVTALLDLLDMMDGDCDLEDNADAESSLGGLEIHAQVDLEIDNADSEPLLGAPEIAPDTLVYRGGCRGWKTEQGTQERWSQGGGDMEEEAVDEDGGNILDENHDGELDMHEGDQRDDFEYSLGWTTAHEDVGQGYGALVAGHVNGDAEADYASDDGRGWLTARSSDEEDNLGSVPLQGPDGTIYSDREASGMSLDDITDDHGCGTTNDVWAH
ncbi:MAG: hypothetical protein JWQ89_298 [Devosia sp.]|uniref:hypothetical protein n=1 Tax=Devosia sp. TaxID=1871048 RepID=UPI002627A83D|nr:hypothetical protein [Devosia sp.]MDB5538571.1 hypothetical protein [Devosia sp.]